MGAEQFGMSPMEDAAFSILPTIVILGFVAVFVIIIVTAVKGGMQWNKNNNSPVLTVSARIVAKRISVSTHHHSDDTSMHHTSSSTTYFITFQVESGDRMELRVAAKEYGLLAEGDDGRLTFQGTRYKGFERGR